MSYEIEKGVKIPEGRSYRGKEGGLSQTLRQMETGDSIFLFDKKLSNISGHVQYIKHTTKRNFICRSVDGGVRIWRTE